MLDADPDFKYSVQIDGDNGIKTLTWTMERCCEKYVCFGDVLTFHTTYRTNLYDMSFGLFLGVNNHFQSIILGGVLMRDEKEESFKWVFAEFMQMIGGKDKHPRTILTDQARSMELAIAEVLPGMTHRWCKLHVLNKEKESLGALYGKQSDFRADFNRLVSELYTEDEFEKGWASMLDKYSLWEQPYLTQIYKVRHKWAKPYFRNVFCAKMTSTQQSDSANHMLKDYVPPGCLLSSTRNCNSTKTRRKAIKKKGLQFTSHIFCIAQAGVVLKANVPIEIHASKVYRRAMFEQFGKALYESGQYVLHELEPKKLYLARSAQAVFKEKWCKVVFRVEVKLEKDEFSCECAYFDHTGMPCAHALKVMVHLGCEKIPTQYIMKRWTRDACDILPPRLLRYQKDQVEPTCATYRHSNLKNTALEIIALANSNIECYDEAMHEMLKLKERLKPMSVEKDGLGVYERENAATKEMNISGISAPVVAEHTNLLSSAEKAAMTVTEPSKKRPAGRPTNKRDKASYEEMSQRTRFCSFCMLAGHEITTCPQRGDVPSQARKEPRCSNCGVTGHRKNTCTNPKFPMM